MVFILVAPFGNSGNHEVVRVALHYSTVERLKEGQSGDYFRDVTVRLLGGVSPGITRRFAR